VKQTVPYLFGCTRALRGLGLFKHAASLTSTILPKASGTGTASHLDALSKTLSTRPTLTNLNTKSPKKLYRSVVEQAPYTDELTHQRAGYRQLMDATYPSIDPGVAGTVAPVKKLRAG
jgi:hypothetical protein